MRYCKNCGRELKDGVRFCERCGKSVRQNRDNENVKKQEQIEKLQKERLERKRRQEQRENIEKKRKERVRQKRAKQNKVLFGALGVVAAIALISVVTYQMFAPDEDNASAWVNQNGTENAATTLPTMQPSSTIAPVGEVEAGSGDSLSNVTSKDDYGVFELSNGVEVPYPEVFEKVETEGDEKLNLSDKYGGQATMTVHYEEYPGGTPSGLMKEYANEVDGKVTYSLAGSNWYGITVENDGEIRHRKYIIDHTNDCVAYYDFVYDESSDYAEDYEAYIDYIDENFGY